MAGEATRRLPLASAYRALAESRFSRLMNWLLAAAGVAYAAWVVTDAWPEPGWLALVACLGACLGIAMAAVDVQRISMRLLGRFLLRGAVRRKKG